MDSAEASRLLPPVSWMQQDDCQATYLELEERGIEFIMKPTEVPYGIGAQFHDPVGKQAALYA